MAKTKNKPLRVDSINNGWDQHIKRGAQMGISAKVLADETGLSVFQVRYRLSVQGIHINDYRAGITPASRRLLEQSRIAIRRAGLALKPYGKLLRQSVR